MKQRKLDIRIIKNADPKPIRNKIFIATPTLGVIRTEWAQARWGAVIPCNWSSAGCCYGYSQTFPQGFLVAEAQNLAVDAALAGGYEWLLLLEDDVCIPPDTFLKFNKYMREATIPVVSGLYFVKGNYPEPMVYRGRGNGFYPDWKRGDKVWVDGCPTGCLLIHTSLLKLMAEESEEYNTGVGKKVKKVFETPSSVWRDPEKGGYMARTGTSDLFWCDRVIKDKVLERSGWKSFAKKHPKYPFLIDTTIFCKHIDLSTGKTYPLGVK